MLRSFRSELIKLNRFWMIAGTVGPLLAFSVISTVVQFTIADRVGPVLREAGLQSRQDLAAADGLARVLADSAPFGGVIVVVVFATGFATEYGWGTLRNILVRQPNRTALLIGKFMGLLALILAGRLVASVGSVLTALVMAQIEAVPTVQWFGLPGWNAMFLSVVNLMLAAVGWASLGTAAAILIRAPGAAVGVVLAFFPLEGLINGWWDGGPRWLPGQIFAAVANGGSVYTSYQRALALTLGCSLLALSLSIWMFDRSDVTA